MSVRLVLVDDPFNESPDPRPAWVDLAPSARVTPSPCVCARPLRDQDRCVRCGRQLRRSSHLLKVRGAELAFHAWDRLMREAPAHHHHGRLAA